MHIWMTKVRSYIIKVYLCRLVEAALDANAKGTVWADWIPASNAYSSSSLVTVVQEIFRKV